MKTNIEFEDKIIGQVDFENDSLKKITFRKKQAVPDSIRGYLYYSNKEWKFVECEKRFDNNSSDKQILFLILESPHKDEYDDKYRPIYPAQGTTGDRIKKKIVYRQKIVGSLKKEEEYLLVLVNPVQYQASCYYELIIKNRVNKWSRSNKEKVFRMLFGKRGANLRDDFIKRINKGNPRIIVNCCTSKLKPIVNTAIKDSNYSSLILSDIHPSAW